VACSSPPPARPNSPSSALTSIRLEPFSPVRYVQIACIGHARFEQRRFGEGAALLKEARQLAPSYFNGAALLVACLSHLGEAAAAQPAIAALQARFAASSVGWTSVMTEFLFRSPDHRRLFTEGVALAESRAARLGQIG